MGAVSSSPDLGLIPGIGAWSRVAVICASPNIRQISTASLSASSSGAWGGMRIPDVFRLEYVQARNPTFQPQKTEPSCRARFSASLSPIGWKNSIEPGRSLGRSVLSLNFVRSSSWRQDTRANSSCARWSNSVCAADPTLEKANSAQTPRATSNSAAESASFSRNLWAGSQIKYIDKTRPRITTQTERAAQRSASWTTESNSSGVVPGFLTAFVRRSKYRGPRIWTAFLAAALIAACFFVVDHVLR